MGWRAGGAATPAPASGGTAVASLLQVYYLTAAETDPAEAAQHVQGPRLHPLYLPSACQDPNHLLFQGRAGRHHELPARRLHRRRISLWLMPASATRCSTSPKVAPSSGILTLIVVSTVGM